MITTQAGRYTPSITLADNIVNASVSECFWTNFTSFVRVSGELIISTENTGILSKVLIDIPHYADVPEFWQISGTGIVDHEVSVVATIVAENNKACLLFKPDIILNNVKIPFSFSYNL